MRQYLLSVYQPGGPIPAPEVLEKISRELDVLNQNLKAAGAWVFAGGLYPPSAATVVRLQDGAVLTTDGPFAEGRGNSAGSPSSTRPISTPRSSGAISSPGRPRCRLRCGCSGTKPRTDTRRPPFPRLGDQMCAAGRSAAQWPWAAPESGSRP
jgi:hypothetical protein